MAFPGATLNEAAEIFQKNSKWYARVSVDIPHATERPTPEWIGVDVGAQVHYL
jgi:transposase